MLSMNSLAGSHASPDGAINIPDDIFGVALQFGHSCAYAEDMMSRIALKKLSLAIYGGGPQ